MYLSGHTSFVLDTGSIGFGTITAGRLSPGGFITVKAFLCFCILTIALLAPRAALLISFTLADFYSPLISRLLPRKSSAL